MRPRWIIVCNFAQFLIYDMETLITPTKILLSELPEKFHVFDFLIDHTKTRVVGKLKITNKSGKKDEIQEANIKFVESAWDVEKFFYALEKAFNNVPLFVKLLIEIMF